MTPEERSQAGEVETALIRQAARGDRIAFEELVSRYQSQVYRVCYRFFNDPDEAMDATQEVFLKAFRSIGRFEGRSSFKTWIYRIATNTCLSITEERKRRQKGLLEAILGWFSPDTHHPDPAETAVEREYGRQLQQVIQEKVSRIPEIYRIPVILKDMEGHSLEEIARILEVPEGTVKSRLNRGRKLLQEALEPFLEERRTV